MNKRKKTIYGLIIFCVLLIGVIGVSFALWTQNFTQSGENTIASDCFQIVLNEEQGILLENSFPMYDRDGKKLTPYTFEIRNVCDRKVEYQLNFETTNNTTLSDTYVKFMFQEEEPVLLSEKERTKVTLTNGFNAYVLEEGYFLGNTSKSYSIRIWMDENVTSANKDAMNRLFEGKITITASYMTRYYEEILNGTDPVLKEGLIPVTISDNGEVRKADLNQKWYKYEDREWANAVILNDESQEYQNGQVIPEGAIESYFVWIPRYKYQIFNVGNYTSMASSVSNIAKEIKIEFENKDTPKSTGSTMGSWLTHPAFTAFETNGMWVGKFKTGYKGAETKAQALVNEVLPEKVQIKPNVNSWRGIQVANAYLTSVDYKKEYNSHMMKNTEWGAVAYLQHSKYGSRESVRINNNEDYVTGYAGVNEPTTGYTATNISCATTPKACNEYGTSDSITKPWNTDTGVLASTTKNITGVYDMSGGAWEYVMGVMVNDKGIVCSGRDATYNSGFKGAYCDASGSNTTGVDFPTDHRYYDLYAYAIDDEHYDRRILGDATGEVGPFATKKYGTQTRQVGSWHDDEAWFVDAMHPWSVRGGGYGGGGGTGAGVFAFGNNPGSVHTSVSFRLVLSV